MTERHVLVTGYPGFIARRLVKKLLAADRDLRLSLLVEPSQEAAARQELQRLLDAGTTDLDAAERATLMVGDVTAMDLGLSGAEFRRLAEEVTEIFHLAAVHSLSADRRRQEAVNVQGTANVLSVARALGRLERLVHFSSAYVSGDRRGVIMEDELERGQQFRNSYEATKHQAELLMERAKDRLPITVVRPSAVVGDSRTGEIDRFDSVYHLGMLLVASPVKIPIPLAGDGRAPLNLVPVDYVVDAVHALACAPDTVGKTFHVVDPNPLPARRVYEAIAERAGRRLPRLGVSPNLTKALLRIPGMERFAAVSHQAIDYLNHMAFYNSRNTMDALVGTGITCPRFEDYVENLMQYVRDYFDRAGRWRDVEGGAEERA
jgi:thioester reductase-like protein